jgi:hypothetical protein
MTSNVGVVGVADDIDGARARRRASVRGGKRAWSAPAVGWSKDGARLLSANYTPTKTHPYSSMMMTVAYHAENKSMVAMLLVLSEPTAPSPGSLHVLAVTPVSRYSEKQLKTEFADALARVEAVLDDPNPKALDTFLALLDDEYEKSGSPLSNS